MGIPTGQSSRKIRVLRSKVCFDNQVGLSHRATCWPEKGGWLSSPLFENKWMLGKLPEQILRLFTDKNFLEQIVQSS